MYDIIIKNAKVFDGAGTPFFFADVAVKDGKIAAVGKHISGGHKIIDAAGLALSPGFIDSHSHNDTAVEGDPSSYFKLEQGITTEVTGTCGISRAPVSAQFEADGIRAASLGGDMRLECRRTFGKYLDMADTNYGPNLYMQLGHGLARAAACGYAPRDLTASELDTMLGYVDEAMQAGAAGVSFGLIYPPGSYAQEAELTEVCKVVAKYGGTFSTHMRNEGARLVESVEETIRMARASGCRGVISHHKASGKNNHGKTARTIELIEQAANDGVELYLDQYPYGASSTGLSTMIPNDMHALGIDKLVEMCTTPDGRKEMRRRIELDRGVAPGGDISATLTYVMVAGSKSHPEYGGRMLCDIALEQGADAYELMIDLLRDDRIGTGAIYFTMCDEDIERVMSYRRTMVGTDGLTTRESTSGHPRAVGTFPRFLGRYVRDKGLMTMEEGIRRITSMPAAVYNLQSKGLIRVGMDADLVLFDENNIIDNADYKAFNAKNTGIGTVFVAGRPVVENGNHNGKLMGRLIRRG